MWPQNHQNHCFDQQKSLIRLPIIHYFQTEVIPNTEENDLFLAMRGAGSNYAIVTEFLYKIYHHPETTPVIVPIYVENIYDIK